ncbi:MAG: hypothetical protein JXR53_11380 [Bacteroidales bacterium]|nr:hypothetical protein [Bacteroidales bacterium]
MNFNSFLRINQIIAFAAMASVIIISFVMYYLMSTMTYTEDEFILGEIFLIVNVAVIALSFVLTRFLKGKIVDATKNAPLLMRFTAFRIHLILCIAFYEMAGIMAGVFMYISGRIEFLIISLAALLLIFMHFPNRMKVKTSLGLSDRELIEGLD